MRDLLRKLIDKLTPEPTTENVAAVLGACILLVGGTFALLLCALVVAVVLGL